MYFPLKILGAIYVGTIYVGKQGATHAPSLSAVTLVAALSGGHFAGTVRSTVTSTAAAFATPLSGPSVRAPPALSAACEVTQADWEERREK